ncbi:PspC domain-containing protein [Micromonospora sp. NPDC049679]|uniref:PspC domain-containing protein n=1 Tax=Micromonospora sp. NPDC049679 TaxID=3155920 RepID=UPI0033E44870
MTDEAAESRRPANTEDAARARPPLPGPAPSDPNDAPRPHDEPTATDLGAAPTAFSHGPDDEPTTAFPPAGSDPTRPFPPAADGDPTNPGPPSGPPGGSGGTAGPGGPGGPPPGPGGPPPWGQGGGYPPPFAGSAFTSRYGLVRPRNGRYLAGVCAAIGRATNTDPILWRVLLAVLGFAGGIGILIYLAAWLVIPNEGDTASPVESMLGRGRSSMSPITVLILSVLVAVMFGLIVTDGFRAIVLGAAILIGGALLLNRDSGGRPGRFTPSPDPVGPPPPGAVPTPGWMPPTGPSGTPAMPGTPVTPYPPSAGDSGTAASPHAPSPYLPGTASAPAPYAVPPQFGAAAQFPAPPPFATPFGAPQPDPAAYPPAAPPPSGYRAPFAPHGPYAGRGPYPPGFQAAPVKPVKPPKQPKERSPLGAATFSMIFVALGLVAMVDLTHVAAVPVSAYFVGALVTIALGLLIGAWFGRARWLIALGLVVSAALGVASVSESYTQVRGESADVNWQPAAYEDLADRYANRFGDAVLDLRSVDFSGRDTQVTTAVDFGQLRVILPPNVDVDAQVEVRAGDARVFNTTWSGFEQPARTVTDAGPDGPGGGKLRLVVHVNAGNVEVYR